ncbi:prenyltransferase [Amycolatopsis sp. NBC_00345]|uniref:prenyltransferase/squalene oxidase repeat-containing protein n=1 Tax=Amycolatopsis sp. NBC_00345 TaxID=2975955 RepID=UPI002E256556
MIDTDATAAFIRRTQQPDGAIPWFTGGKLDPWDHVEAAMGLDSAGFHREAAAAYRWLARTQNPDGSWHAEYRDSHPVELARDANFTAYIAVGAYHHFLSTQDSSFLEELWPTVDSAMAFVLSMQAEDGAIRWRENPDGTFQSEKLLTGNCSIHHALTTANRIAGHLGHERPQWTSAADRIRDAVLHHTGSFLPKSLAMDWYYPVLTGLRPLPDLEPRWNVFVHPERGVRCVDHEPWTTGGETAELALALAAHGDIPRATALLAAAEHLAAGDGSYWTGHNYDTDTIWPRERTTWTAGAILLAQSAIHGSPPALAVFGAKACAPT